MPTYAYTARDEAGRPVNGTVDADSVSAVTQSLRASGKYPTSVRLATAADMAGDGTASSTSSADAARPRSGMKISRAEVIQLSTQLAIMLETGVTLTEALDCIAQQSEIPRVRDLVQDLHDHVTGGSDFSAALNRHPRSFPRLYIALIKASEKSGMMSKLLSRATAYLRDEQETTRRVKGALTYPGIMFGFAITTTIFLLAFVLPRFTAIYASKGAALPLPTKIMMTMSDAVINHWIVLLSSAAGLVTAIVFGRRTPVGSRCWDWLQLHLPLLGSMFRKLHLSRGMRMIGTMAGAGVSLVDCVHTAIDLCPNSYFREMWDHVLVQIQAGKQMSEPMRQSPLVPRSIAQMLYSGEKGGKLAFVMEQVAGYSETELKEKIAELTRYIEPAMIVLMGVIIGGVALALMLPIFTISKVVAR